ncbi:MAG: hypothetical protein ABL900_05445 [Burkholderiaceae bacterium]
MSAIGDAIGAIREALKLSDDVKRAGETVKEVARELREHDRRITRLEAQWETALALTQRSAPKPIKLSGKRDGE